MTAFIEGSVQTPTGRIVPMTVHAKPIPEPGVTPPAPPAPAGPSDPPPEGWDTL